jgi:hypothetical protein
MKITAWRLNKMNRKPLYSSGQPLPERSYPNYGVFVLAAAALIAIVLGTALGTGIDQESGSPQNLEEDGADLLIPDTGMESQESVTEQRQSMRCALGGGSCPPPEGGDE